MTTSRGDLAAGADSFARDWRAVRADSDIQFAALPMPKPPEIPAWLTALGDWLTWLLGPVGRLLVRFGPAVPWVAGALAIGLALYILWRLREPIAAWSGRPRAAAAAEPEWQPDQGAALALLEDADRLAAEGRFDEAARLLLQRSVGQIAAARPGLLDPSSTAREIALLPALPEAARAAFATIAERVERSLFALRRLTADDWHAARAAYSGFALS
ncbi:MAG: hypothetical protein ABIO26_04710 [Croceibacterium sp.]